jgi:sucrose phosphorylase
MEKILKELYGEQAPQVQKQIQDLIDQYQSNQTKKILDQTDSLMITYGDSILDGDQKPLQVLHSFLKNHVKDAVSGVHLLPMFTYTSDDGFSVVDYLEVNKDLGDWDDVTDLSQDYDLMFDAVINHISKSSEWFKEYASGNPRYDNYFIEKEADVDYSSVVRPRSLPLFYSYETSQGKKDLWATFSEDQLDINYENPAVLIDVLKVLLEYAKNGATYIRFDAIGFIWKKKNTTCIHLDETHLLVKLMRKVLDQTYPSTKIISETNVPHHENITYFGNGYDEAHLVYQFPLPPLTLYAFLSGDASKLSMWADSLKETALTCDITYFNFLASHDGIGMRPTEGILTDEEKQLMVDATLKRGGRIGYKNNSDGSKSPYELNINYLDALCEEDLSVLQKTKKFMAAQTILLSLQGVPGIYIHSLLGSRNDYEGLISSNINRRINREKLDLKNLEFELRDSTSLRYSVFNEYKRLLEIRKQEDAFSPSSLQDVVYIDSKIFSLKRISEDSTILVLVNVSNEVVRFEKAYKGVDLISGQRLDTDFKLEPHQYVWLKLDTEE